jgi:hypothetical protein
MKASETDFEWKGGGWLVHSATGTTFFMHDGKVDVSHSAWGGASGAKASTQEHDASDLRRVAEKMFADARTRPTR